MKRSFLFRSIGSRAGRLAMLCLPLFLLGLLPMACDTGSGMHDYDYYDPTYGKGGETDSVRDVTATTATCGGSVYMDYRGDSITMRGVCWSTHSDPTIGDNKTIDGAGKGSFISRLTGLEPATVYFVRAYAIDSTGIWYDSRPVMFVTADTGTGVVTDIDGNVYHEIRIGTQVWMHENLRVTRLRTGKALARPADRNAWSALQSPGYAWYDNDSSSNRNTYGALYNWDAVSSGKLAPEGWHVPTNADWTTLSDFLGGDYVAGGKLKEATTAHWLSPNTDADNTSGFTGFPGGARSPGGVFSGLGSTGWWWSSTATDKSNAWHVGLDYGSGVFQRTASLFAGYGFSVRCVRDK